MFIQNSCCIESNSFLGYAHWTTFSKEILAGNPLRRSQISPADLQRSLILERVQSLESACDSADLSAYQFNFYQVTSRFYVDKQANLSYCKVPKAGSSFMTEIFFALDKDEKNNSKNSILKSKSIDEIFEMSRNRVHMIGNSKLGATPMLNDKELNTTVLLVSRNPYSRLYSAYVDKFYLFGLVKTAMEISKKNKKRLSSCGYDVTFPEFLDHVITTAYGGYPINRHWAPVYLLCHACDVKYDVVSKMDTLSNDMESILDYTNVSYSTRSSLINIIHRKYENKTAISLINVYIKSWNQYKKLCPDFLEYLSKIWKSFKIQGKLRIDLLFPKRKFAKAIKGEININEVIAIFLEYMTKYKMTSGERKLQRRRALVKAFSTVSEETITKIQELYKLDFMLFQYDTSPPTVVS